MDRVDALVQVGKRRDVAAVRPKAREAILEEAFAEEPSVLSIIIAPRLLVELLSFLGIHAILNLLSVNTSCLLKVEPWEVLAKVLGISKYASNCPEIPKNNWRDLILYGVIKLDILCSYCKLQAWDGFTDLWFWDQGIRHTSNLSTNKKFCKNCFFKRVACNTQIITEDHPLAKNIDPKSGYCRALKKEGEEKEGSNAGRARIPFFFPSSSSSSPAVDTPTLKFDDNYEVEQDLHGPLGTTLKRYRRNRGDFSCTQFALYSDIKISVRDANTEFKLTSKEVKPFAVYDQVLEQDRVQYSKVRELALEKSGDAFNLAIKLREKDFLKINKSVSAAEKRERDAEKILKKLKLPEAKNWAVVKDFLARNKCKANIASRMTVNFNAPSSFDYQIYYKQKSDTILQLKQLSNVLTAIKFFRDCGVNIDPMNVEYTYDAAYFLQIIDKLLITNSNLEPRPIVEPSDSASTTTSSSSSSSSAPAQQGGWAFGGERRTLIQRGFKIETYTISLPRATWNLVPDALHELFTEMLKLSYIRFQFATQDKSDKIDMSIASLHNEMSPDLDFDY